MTEWLRLLEVVQSREAVHTVDISVPETLRVIHKPLPSTYILMCKGTTRFLRECCGTDNASLEVTKVGAVQDKMNSSVKRSPKAKPTRQL